MVGGSGKKRRGKGATGTGASQFRQRTIPPSLVSLLYLFFGSRPFSIFCLGGIPPVREPSTAFLMLAKKHPLNSRTVGCGKGALNTP